MALFCAKISGSNGCQARAYSEGVTLVADPGIGWDTVRVESDHPGLGAPALFETREEARAVGLACHWNNQMFDVCVARGRTRAHGKIVKITGRLTSCQES